MERVRTIEEKAHCLSKLVNSIGNPEDEVLWAEYAANGKSGVVSYIEKQLTELLDDILERRVSIDHFKVLRSEMLKFFVESLNAIRLTKNFAVHFLTISMVRMREVGISVEIPIPSLCEGNAISKQKVLCIRGLFSIKEIRHQNQ